MQKDSASVLRPVKPVVLRPVSTPLSVVSAPSKAVFSKRKKAVFAIFEIPIHNAEIKCLNP
jgi:hypothetical protein